MTASPGMVPFHLPTIDEDDIAAVVEVLRTGWITTGSQCVSFENAFAAYLAEAAEEPLTAISVNSATAALHLALEALGVGEGDLVLTTPYTFTATSEVIRYLGAHPVFVDVDPTTGNIEADGVRDAFGSLSPSAQGRVKAVLPVHFSGLPCDMTALCQLAEANGWAVVDDAAHALPARHSGSRVGTWGDASAFSFYATKPLCTGEGGMLVTRHSRVAKRARTMRLHGIDRDVFDRYERPNSWYYEVIAPGFKYNLTDLAAALGLSQLRRVDSDRGRRAQIAAAYDTALAGVDGLRLPPRAEPGDEHSWHLYALRVVDGLAVRDELVRALSEAGVMTSVHFIPLHIQPYYRDAYDLQRSDFPAATRLYEEEVSLPIYPSMAPAQIDAVVEAVPRALARARDRVSRRSRSG